MVALLFLVTVHAADSQAEWRWTEGSHPRPRIEAIWVDETGEAYAVGDRRTIVQWDGADLILTDTGHADLLVGISGRNENDIYAIDSSGGNLLHWDGRRWLVDHQFEGHTRLVDLWVGDAAGPYVVDQSTVMTIIDGEWGEALRDETGRSVAYGD